MHEKGLLGVVSPKLLSLQIQGAYDTGIPSQLSYGFVCGYCSGYALKVIGRGTAVVFGTFTRLLRMTHLLLPTQL